MIHSYQQPLRLLIRPMPLSNELPLSWVVRLAIGNRIKVNSVSWLLTGRRNNLLSMDADWQMPDAAIARLEHVSGLEPRHVSAMSLFAYRSHLVGFDEGGGGRRWVLSVGSESQAWTKHGQQYCASCLMQETPYFRRPWRLVFSVICTKHREFLQDRCPVCHRPVAYFRVLHRPSHKVDDQLPAHCSDCGSDLRSRKGMRVLPVDTELQVFQGLVNRALDMGWLEFGGRPIYSNSFFDGLYRIWTVMMRGRRRSEFLSAALSGTDDFAFGYAPRTRGKIEDLRICDRLLLMRASASLLANWPRNFVIAAKEARLRPDDFLDFRLPAPYWLESVCKEALGFGRRWSKSFVERDAVAVFLRRHGLSDSTNNVNRWLGAWYVPSKGAEKCSVLEEAEGLRRMRKRGHGSR